MYEIDLKILEKYFSVQDLCEGIKIYGDIAESHKPDIEKDYHACKAYAFDFELKRKDTSQDQANIIDALEELKEALLEARVPVKTWSHWAHSVGGGVRYEGYIFIDEKYPPMKMSYDCDRMKAEKATPVNPKDCKYDKEFYGFIDYVNKLAKGGLTEDEVRQAEKERKAVNAKVLKESEGVIFDFIALEYGASMESPEYRETYSPHKATCFSEKEKENISIPIVHNKNGGRY